jgi:hypothetical protein
MKLLLLEVHFVEFGIGFLAGVIWNIGFAVLVSTILNVNDEYGPSPLLRTAKSARHVTIETADW